LVKRVFERGDIIRICLNPTSGNETRGDFRPCLILSTKAFNRLGLVMVAPITQGGNYARYHGFAVPLLGMETQGVVLVNGVRSVDVLARQAKFVEHADSIVIDECLAKLAAIFE